MLQIAVPVLDTSSSCEGVLEKSRGSGSTRTLQAVTGGRLLLENERAAARENHET